MYHSVEKIGGTSMIKFDVLLNNIFIKKEPYNRIFVVSAYAQVTDKLLENKKTLEPGIFQLYAKSDYNWKNKFLLLLDELKEINYSFQKIGLDLTIANDFIEQRIQESINCLSDVERLCSYGHFQFNDYLPVIKELLSSIGEAHSAFNTSLILNSNGINSQFIDLTGWKDKELLPFEKKITASLKNIAFDKQVCITPGYTKCLEGLLKKYDRGYSEITFSKVASITKAKEGIIHKEFHLCTADPKIVGIDNVKIIGATNFDVADQLADLAMEAIHPQAAKNFELSEIPLRVKNCFDPDHLGTSIDQNFISKEAKIEMICGRKDLLAVEVLDNDMVGKHGYDQKLTELLTKYQLSYIGKNTNANTITHYLAEKQTNELFIKGIKEIFPKSHILEKKVAVVSCIGSNINSSSFLLKCTQTLANKHINILAIGHCLRQVNLQFIIERKDFEEAIKSLHYQLIEKY